MEISRKIIILIGILFVFQNAFSQNEKAFCKAVINSNLKKTERIVNEIIKNNRNGQVYYNGEGSGNQINFTPSLDSITYWLKRQDCVEDAIWDRCQEKVDLYPSFCSIGVKFKTKNGTIQKCFLIQKGTTGKINILGWTPKIFKSKMILVCKKMSDCENFIENQRKNCKENE